MSIISVMISSSLYVKDEYRLEYGMDILYV
jgi:hypothetical protein